MSGTGAPLWWDGAGAVAVEANAMVRGGELAGPASLALLDDRLVVVGDAPRASRRTGQLASVELRYDRLDGARREGNALSLFFAGEDLLELVPAGEDRRAFDEAAAEIVRRACPLPELTLSLRSLGSRGAGADHDAFFGPLLAARAAAERAPNPEARVRAVDGAALRASLDAAVREAAARRAPASPPERRALEAELGECVAPLARALDDLGARARVALDAADDARFARWREWADALGRVFARADGCWEASLPALARETRTSKRPSAVGRLWRRIRGD